MYEYIVYFASFADCNIEVEYLSYVHEKVLHCLLYKCVCSILLCFDVLIISMFNHFCPLVRFMCLKRN